jgi:hypothetical protein
MLSNVAQSSYLIHIWVLDNNTAAKNTLYLSSATNLVSVRNTWVFLMALTALTEPRTLRLWMRPDPSPKRRVALHTSLVAAIVPCLWGLRPVALHITLAAPLSGFLYFASGMWWRIRTTRTTQVLHSSQDSNYIVGIYPMPSAVYTFLWPSAASYLSAIAIYRMPQSPIYI